MACEVQAVSRDITQGYIDLGLKFCKRPTLPKMWIPVDGTSLTCDEDRGKYVYSEVHHPVENEWFVICEKNNCPYFQKRAGLRYKINVEIGSKAGFIMRNRIIENPKLRAGEEMRLGGKIDGAEIVKFEQIGPNEYKVDLRYQL